MVYCEIGGTGGPAGGAAGTGAGVDASAAGGVGLAEGVSARHSSEPVPDVAAGGVGAAGEGVAV